MARIHKAGSTFTQTAESKLIKQINRRIVTYAKEFGQQSSVYQRLANIVMNTGEYRQTSTGVYQIRNTKHTQTTLNLNDILSRVNSVGKYKKRVKKTVAKRKYGVDKPTAKQIKAVSEEELKQYVERYDNIQSFVDENKELIYNIKELNEFIHQGKDSNTNYVKDYDNLDKFYDYVEELKKRKQRGESIQLDETTNIFETEV